MDRPDVFDFHPEAITNFRDQFRLARQAATDDAEQFDQIIHAIERLGSFLSGGIGDLGKYYDPLEQLVRPLEASFPITPDLRSFRTPFCVLYNLVRTARNDALHQGAFARHLTQHVIELSLILEDALMSRIANTTVCDYMVRNPVCAELWQPVSFVRQQMLANSFSFLPVRDETGQWYLISDRQLARYLAAGSGANDRNGRLVTPLSTIRNQLISATCVTETVSVAQAICSLGDHPLLVVRQGERADLLGILTAFDLL